MRKYLLLISALLLCSSSFSQLLQSPESVVYDAPRDRYIISNAANSRLVSEDSDGQQFYLAGPNSGSHGLAIIGDRLFSCVKNSILIHDLTTDEKIGSYTVPGAVFLNGLCSDGDRMLYATDFSKRRVYSFDFDGQNGLTHSGLTTLNDIPNGLAYDEENSRLLIVTWGRDADILEYDFVAEETRVLKSTTYDNLESIVVDTDGSMYISGWVPAHLLRFNEEADVIEELNVMDLEKPTGLVFGRQSELVMLGSEFSTLKSSGITSRLKAVEFNVQVFPNPITTNGFISYDLSASSKVTVDLYDTQGRMIKRLQNGEAPQGQQNLLFDRRDIPAGMYFINVRSEEGDTATPVTLVD